MTFIDSNIDICKANADWCIANGHALFLCNLTTTEGITAVQSFVQSEYGKSLGATMPQRPFTSDCFYFTVPFEGLAGPAYHLRPDVLNVIAFNPVKGRWHNHYILPVSGSMGRFFVQDDQGKGKT